jgi:hypothetical protein
LLNDGEVTNLLDDQTCRQLLAVRYRHTPKQKIAIESKDEYRKRIGGSPDRAEATIMSYLPPVDMRAVTAVAFESFEKESVWQ